MKEDRETTTDVDRDDDKSLIEKAQDKIDDMLDVEEAADDPGMTNAVTGHPREP